MRRADEAKSYVENGHSQASAGARLTPKASQSAVSLLFIEAIATGHFLLTPALLRKRSKNVRKHKDHEQQRLSEKNAAKAKTANKIYARYQECARSAGYNPTTSDISPGLYKAINRAYGSFSTFCEKHAITPRYKRRRI